MTGRGRGESKHVHLLDESDEMLVRDRAAQMEAASELGIPEGSIPIRGRGGFRQPELRTIPANATEVSTRNLQSVRQIDILANYVQMTAMPNKVIQMYRVEFTPKIEAVSVMRYLFRAAAGQVFERMPIFDGMHECRCAQKLPDKVTTVTVEDERGGDKRKYTVTFTNTGTVAFGAESLRIYNMQMKEFLRTLGFYQPQTGIYVHDRLATEINPEIMMMRGFRTSANVHDQGKTLMNLEAAHKLMQRKNVLQIMDQIRQNLRGGNLPQALNSELVGKLVVTSYDKRAYRIEDVRTNIKPTDTFDCKGETISYVDYYKRVRNVTITQMNQPMLLVVPNNKRSREEVSHELYLVPELCNIAGLTEPQRNDNRLKMDLIRSSQVPPDDRVRHLREFLRQFHSNEQIKTRLAEWGYSYAQDAVKLQAYVIPPTKVAFGQRCNQPPTAWDPAHPESADIRVDGLAVSKGIKKMGFICSRPDLQNKNQIMTGIKAGFDQVRLAVGGVHQVDLNSDRATEYIQAIERLPKDVDCAIVIVPRQNKELYNAIKKAASVERGLITQVVTARLMMDQRKARSAATKIAIQVAAKVGGEPWWADIPLKQTMVCGYDTYHDTASRGRSYGAFLASMNDKHSRWWSKADAHDKLEEISSQIAANMTEAIKQYRSANSGSFPDRVIIYRDGVGEGQLEHVFRVELTRIQEALGNVGSPKKIMLTMIVVNKRIGARFYMRANEGRFANPPPGSVIDHTVTRQERYDFYLVSQSTRQGSITPTYYNIIHDECGFRPEIHQKMAYKFCLLYYNWAGTVRVPAPCQYAHKLALLCGEHLHAQPNSVMDDRLHFL